jgi:ribosomal protein L37E
MKTKENFYMDKQCEKCGKELIHVHIKTKLCSDCKPKKIVQPRKILAKTNIKFRKGIFYFCVADENGLIMICETEKKGRPKKVI